MVEKILDKEIEEKVLKADHPVILDFWNQGCGPCQALGPVLEELSEEEKDIKFYSIRIDEGEEAVKRFPGHGSTDASFYQGWHGEKEDYRLPVEREYCGSHRGTASGIGG